MTQPRTWLLTSLLFMIVLLSVQGECDFLRMPTFQKQLFSGKSTKKYNFPDFYKYRRVRTLSAAELTLDERNRRLVTIGDIHGMNESFHDLLGTISYNSTQDTIILAGDFLVKTGIPGSLAMLDFLAHDPGRVYAVRGNHDQIVVEWRAWRDWFEALEIKGRTGKAFLAMMEAQWYRAQKKGLDADEWAHRERKRAAGTWKADWWHRVPTPGKGRERKHWELFSEHYWLAKEMTKKHTQLLYDMPTILHILSEHMLVVHAGLLPFDLRRPPTDARQPLAHAPSIDMSSRDEFPDQEILAPRIIADDEEELRVAQEKALLSDVLQNRDNWVVQNIRGVHHKKVTTSSNKGTPWADLWNDQMNRCVGFDEDAAAKKGKTLPCQPATVVYGHAASRALDVKRWSLGLDTGCMYGRKLTALVLQHKKEEKLHDQDRAKEGGSDEEDEAADVQKRLKTWRKRVDFGDAGGKIHAELVSIKCEAPEDVEPYV